MIETRHLLEGLAALAAVVGAAAGFLRGPLRKAAGGLKARVLADHLSIGSGWFSNDRGGRRRVFINICCGPSRRFRGQQLDRSRAEEWAREYWPEVRAEPTYAAPELLRFEDVNTVLAAGESPMLQIWGLGLIEISLPIDHYEEADGELTLPIEQALLRLLRFIEAIRDGGYESIFGKPFVGRRRLDWRVSISSAVTNETRWQPIKYFSLRGIRLRGKPPEMSIDASMSPDAELTLRSRLSRLETSVIVTTFFQSVLARSGYSKSVVDEVVAEVSSFKSVEDLTSKGMLEAI